MIAAAGLLGLHAAGFSQPTAGGRRPTYSPRELVASVAEMLTSIDSLDCEYDSVMQAAGADDVRVRCRYARFGDQWHKTEFVLQPDGTVREERIVCSDGNRIYSYNVVHLPDGKTRTGTVQIHDFQEPPLISPEYLIGGRISDLRCSLAELDAKYLSEPPTDGSARNSETARLAFTSIPFQTSPDGRPETYDVTIDLSPEHDLMPTMIRLEFSPQTKASLPSHRDWKQEWRVSSFQKVVDERTQQDRWFPANGTLNQGPDAPVFELTLQSVRINANLDERLFDPSVPAGTTIFDLTASGRGRVRLAGGPSAIDRHMHELVDQAGRQSDSRSWRFLAFLIGNSLALTVLAVLLWRRRHTGRN